MALAMALTKVISPPRNDSNVEEPKAKCVASGRKVLLASSPKLQYVCTASGTLTHSAYSSAHFGSFSFHAAAHAPYMEEIVP